MNCSWSVSCIIIPDYQVYCPNEAFKYNIIINTAINIIFAFSSTVLNAGVMWVLYFRKRLQTPYYLILLSLATSDFTAGIVAQPLFITRSVLLVATGGYASCILDRSTVAIGYSLVAVSFFTVSYVTLERYLAVFYPFYHEQQCTRRIAFRWLVVIWVMGSVYGALGCLPNERVTLGLVVMVSIIGTCFLIWNCFAYSRIFYLSKKIQLRVRQERQRFANDEKIVKEAKAAKTTFVIVASLLAFYGPGFLATALRQRVPIFPIYIDVWAYTFMLINSTANPIIYCYFCQDIGREVTRLWHRITGMHVPSGETTV